MIVQFYTLDDARWQLDTGKLLWARLGPDGPNGEAPETLEHGKLTETARGFYSLEPRTPKTEGPGEGLCTAAVHFIPRGTCLHVLVMGNVKIKNPVLPVPLATVNCCTTESA